MNLETSFSIKKKTSCLIILATTTFVLLICGHGSKRTSANNRTSNLAGQEVDLQSASLRERWFPSGNANSAGREKDLLQIWQRANGDTDDRILAATLDAFRRIGRIEDSLAIQLAEFLKHESEVYWERDRLESNRLRAYLMITLGEIGVPDNAWPAILDSLAHPDERMMSFEAGSAAFAVSRSGIHRAFIGPLLGVVGKSFSEEEFSTNRYSVDFTKDEATTAQIEAIKALAVLCHSDDKNAVELLERFTMASGQSERDSRAVQAAKKSLDEILSKPPGKPLALESERTDWVQPNQREWIEQLNCEYTNQDQEHGILADLIDRPTLITYFYTRCQNNYKCSAALTQFAALQSRLKQLKMTDRIQLIAITYEPTFDDPDRLKRFATNRGLQISEGTHVLRIDEPQHLSLIKALNAPVSFSAGSVNSHGIALRILDNQGRLARQYHTLMWDNDQVFSDIKLLLSESEN